MCYGVGFIGGKWTCVRLKEGFHCCMRDMRGGENVGYQMGVSNARVTNTETG